ncbi:MAG: transpeptidase family protein [Acidobacteriales bacterium]|nr:transpeptidase family protein [Terriglobales bacterium]
MEVAAKRGVIYDRAGRELAMSVAVDSAFAVPAEIPDLAGTLSLVSSITKADPRELLAKCQSAKSFCWIARKADADLAQRIRALNLKGIYFQKESKRFYPKRDLAAQILGYVGTDDAGLSGIEREFNDQLKGEAGRMLISVDARKKWFGSVERQPQPGQSVVLTLDEKIQYIAERELQAAMEQTHAISGTVVVQNPHTGEILGLANWPTFNPNKMREIKPEDLKNHAVSDAYEPGSTFKLVTLSAALDQHLVKPEEVFDCQMGSIVISGRRIHDWKPFGMLSVADILAHSSDVGAIKVALRLGDERFYNYIRAFGFGQYTGIELPGETRGITKPLSRWSKVSIGAISMGQEIGVSPLQLAGMVSAIANDGVLVPARLVKGRTQPTGSPLEVAFHPAEGRRVVSPATAAQMKQMMQGVVLHGTGKKAILEGYSSAGKTGTAQKIDRATGTYSRTQYIASFAGFAPVNDPAVTIAVILDSPQGGHHGGEVGAPVFNRIAQQVLEYLHTQHDVELPASRQLLLASRRASDQELEEGSPDHLGDALETADAGADPVKTPTPPVQNVRLPVDASLHPSQRRVVSASMGPEMAEESAPPPPLPTPREGTVVLDAEQGGILVPSFAGKTLRAAVEYAEENGLELEVVGSGIARQQEPAPGSRVSAGSHVTVHFTR